MTDNADTRLTPEQLEKNIADSIAAAEKEDKKDEQEEEISTSKESKETEAAKGDEGADDGKSKENGEEKSNDEESEDEDDELETTKKNYADSTREAQILLAKNKRKNEAIDEAAKITDIPEEDLKAEFPEWDDMSSTERKLAKQNMINDKRFALINEVREAEKDVEAWNQKVDDFTTDPKTFNKYKDLEGKIEDFRLFASKESRRGSDFETLVSAFLFNHNKNNQEKKKENRGSMMPTGSGGDKKKSGDGKLTLAEGDALRESNYNEYKRQLMAGNIQEI